MHAPENGRAAVRKEAAIRGGRRRRGWLGTAAAVLALVVASLLTVVGPAAAGQGPARTPVWVGSPINGRWAVWDGYCPGAVYPSDYCSWPTVHHSFSNGMPYVGDWAADLGVGAGQPVNVYAAPNDSSRTITARVEQVGLSCAPRPGESYAQTLSRGGNAVVVAMYDGGTRIGWVTYTHVNPSVAAGQWINRWGAQVGTVGSYTPNSCWTGVHLHVEMTNETNYSCFNKGWQSGQAMSKSNFIGFLGGAYRTAPRQACP
ncbi:MAG: hypothetical protein ACLGIA_05470 [Actinomycetes bacterium]